MGLILTIKLAMRNPECSTQSCMLGCTAADAPWRSELVRAIVCSIHAPIDAGSCCCWLVGGGML
jgi:hypothetical protein